MKEKYKAIIEYVKENKKGIKTIDSLTRYTVATNVSEAQRNIIYHLQNDDKIYLGIDRANSSTDEIYRWEIAKIDIERNYDQLELKIGVGKRGSDKKPRTRRTKAQIENDLTYTKIEVEIKNETYDSLKNYLNMVNLNEKDYFNKMIEKDLLDKNEAINKLKNIMKELID